MTNNLSAKILLINNTAKKQHLLSGLKNGLYKPSTFISKKKPCCKSCGSGGKCDSEKDHEH